MGRPKTCVEFLDLVRTSTVLDAQVLEGYVKKSWPALPAEPVQLARSMIKEGVLTPFQAEQFLLGKSRLTLAGKYNILDRLGMGGMGIVLLCEHKHMRRLVALKVLPSEQAKDQGCLERFYREARAVAQVHHPNIVTAHDIDQDGKYHFIVMEYVDGANLQLIVEQHGPMDIDRACHYIAQAASGLQHAHEIGLVHRDIKPANLLLDRGGTVKVLDLGLVRFFHDAVDKLTEKYDSGSVLGTADYLSPEQTLDSHKADIRSDIYSLGATFYYLLAGKTAFAEGTVARKLIAQLMRIPKPIRQVRPEVPEELEEILIRMTAKNPEDRFQTPMEVVEALAPWIQEPIDAPPDKEMPKIHPAVRSAGPGDSGGSSSSGIDTARKGIGSSPTPRSRPKKSILKKAGRPFPLKTVLGLSAVCLLGLSVGLSSAFLGGKRPGTPAEGNSGLVAPNVLDRPSNGPTAGATATSSADSNWSSYDARGALVRANVARGSSPVFVVPGNTTLIFVTRNFTPLHLGSANASAKVTFSFSVQGGFAPARSRALGFGLYNSKGTPDQLADDTGYFTLWNPGGPYFETYSRTEGGDLFAGTQLSQGGTYQGTLVDDTTYQCQFQLNLNASGTAISLGTEKKANFAGVEVRGPEVVQLCYSNPVSPVLGDVRTFDQFAIKFHNASTRDATLSVRGFQVLAPGAK